MSDGGGGSNDVQQVTNVSTPWGPQVKPLTQSIEDATKLKNAGGLNLQYYPGQTVAGVAPETAQSWNQIAGTAGQPNSAVQGANNYASAILGGDYSALNPAISRINNQVNGAYSKAGRYGSGAHDAAVSDSVGNLIFSQMNNAAQMAPGLNQAQYINPQMLAGVGAQRQGQAQQEINSNIDRFNFNQNAPANAISLYQQLVGGNYGGSSYGTQPTNNPNAGANPWAQYAGLAAQFGGSLLGSMS